MSNNEPGRIYGVIEQIGSEWRTFARTKLNLSNLEIEECQENYHRDLREQRYQMVLQWKRRFGFNATVDRLELHANTFKGTSPPTQQMQQLTVTQSYQQRNNPVMLGASSSRSIHATTPVGDVSDPWFRQDENGNRLKVAIPPTTLVPSKENGSRYVESQIHAGGNDDTVPLKAFNAEDAITKQKNALSEYQNSSANSASTSPSSSTASLRASSETVVPDGKKKKKSVKRRIKSLLKIKKPAATQPSSLQMPPTPGPNGMGSLCDEVDGFQMGNTTETHYQLISKSSSAYDISHPKGLCLILNNSFGKYEGSRRHGSDKDVANMKKLWESIGCELHRGQPQCDKTAEQMEQLLRELTCPKKKYSFIVIVIMTHGGMEKGNLVFKGDDFKNIEVKKIREMFNNANAKALQNIPKFFIFQFCRGKNIDTGVSTDRIEETMKDIIKPRDEPCSSDVVETDGVKLHLPNTSDMLIAYATQEEYAALRNPQSGSWFINAITNVFMNCAANEDAANMLTRVHGQMKNKSGIYHERDSNGQILRSFPIKAMSNHESSFTKKLYFIPGYPHV